MVRSGVEVYGGIWGYLASSKERASWGFKVEGKSHVALGRADGDEWLSGTSACPRPLEGTGARTARSRKTIGTGVGCTDDVALLIENI